MLVSATYRSHSDAHRGPKAAVRLLVTCLMTTLMALSMASQQLTAIRVSEGDDLQAALNRAKAGDVVLLARGARFRGNFVLPVHAGDAYVTLRTDAPNLPGDGMRTGPQYSGTLAVLESPSNVPVLRTASGAHHWRLENIELGPNRGGAGNIVTLGETGGAQKNRETVPHHLVLDRIYIHGDRFEGQKRAIALNSADTEIRNSYIADIKSLGSDAQAIAGWNGPGPFVIENNYLEGAGENVLFGGGDPDIDQLVPEKIVIRRNLFTKPVAWKEPLLATPQSLEVRIDTGGGALAAGTYLYRVAAERTVSGGDQASSSPSPAARAMLSMPGSVSLTWPAALGATRYRIYRAVESGSGKRDAEVSWIVTGTMARDTGEAGSPGAPPKSPSRWTVKNLLELKNARDVIIDGNVFENNWSAAQQGYAVLFKPVNQDGRAPWSTIEGVQFTNNVVRHVSGAININGTDPDQMSARARDIVIRNNLFLDVDKQRWGGSGDFLQIGGGPDGVVVEQNTVMHTGRVLSLYGGPRTTQIARFVFRGNVLRHNEYGVKGADAAIGRATLEAYAPGAVFEQNVLAGGEAGRYPAGNMFPDAASFQREFVDRPGKDQRGVDMDALRLAVGRIGEGHGDK